MEGKKYRLDDGTEVDGFISKLILPDGRVMALKVNVVTAYPIKCPNCGSSFELAFGKGKCDFCGTYFTTEFKIEEVKKE